MPIQIQRNWEYRVKKKKKAKHVTEKVIVELLFCGRFVFIQNIVTGIITRVKAVRTFLAYGVIKVLLEGRIVLTLIY